MSRIIGPGSLWSVCHAALLLTAFGAAALVSAAWPLAAAGALSFSALCAAQRGRWTPSGRFGIANSVTLLRVLLVALSSSVLAAAPGWLLGSTFAGVLALDAVDGWLAKRTHTESVFGAQLDMEADAFLVLTMGVVLWQRGDLGVWIVSAGVLRYAYVLCLALVPARRGELPRSQFGRYAFSLLVLGLITAFALPRPLATAAALAGTLAALISFARGFYYSYSHGAGAGVTTEAALRH